MNVTAVIYDYGEQCPCACYSSQTDRILPPHWQSSRFQERYIINLFCSPHLIYWLTILLDRLCLGMEATSIRQGQVPYGLTAQILDLGLFDICSGVYKGPGPHHCMWFELTVL